MTNVGKAGLALGVVVASFLLAYGGAMVCCVPGYPSESFWQRERIIYGLIPLSGSITLFALIAWLWIRLREISIRAVYRTTFYLLAASLAVIWVGTIIAVLIHSRHLNGVIGKYQTPPMVSAMRSVIAQKPRATSLLMAETEHEIANQEHH